MSGRTVTVSEDVLYRSVDGAGGVILDLERREYFALDEVGARFWEEIVACGDTAAAVDHLLGEFDVDRKTLQRDVAEFARDLAARGLFRLADD